MEDGEGGKSPTRNTGISTPTINPMARYTKGTLGYATDIKRILIDKGCIMENGDLDT